ncbi:MAG: DUF6263 family protein [Candidatus Alcyoniella australis]|nr:DUF6263 family protein [Candidatus Alcyoniella australis]
MKRKPCFRWGSIVLAALWAAWLIPGCAQGVRLTYDPDPGRPLEYRAQERISGVGSIQGVPHQFVESHTLYYRLEHLKSEQRGPRLMRLTCSRFISENDLPSRPRRSFDSQDEDLLAREAYAPMTMLLQRPVTIALNDDGSIELVDGIDGAARSIAQALGEGPQADELAKRLADVLRSDFLLRLLHLRFPPLPAGRVSPGRSWHANRTWSDPLLGDLELRTRYTLERLEGRHDSLAIISFSADIAPLIDELEFPANDLHGVKYEVEVGSLAGTMVLDRHEGVVVSIESTTQVRLTFEHEGEPRRVGLAFERSLSTETVH